MSYAVFPKNAKLVFVESVSRIDRIKKQLKSIDEEIKAADDLNLVGELLELMQTRSDLIDQINQLENKTVSPTMEQTQDTPDFRNQIQFIHRIREALTHGETKQVCLTEKDLDNLKGMEENLISGRNLNDACKSLRVKLSETIMALEEAKGLIKNWYSLDDNPEIAARSWDIYDRMSPEMKFINAIISKYKKEVTNG
jgi:hypothetical protein